ncbi:protein-tyrosine-phosphatase [Opitutus terrae]|uniref:protein-tyrosine-phosphatase n=1 Tax=Opitutus terrae (strain DSM 11246 / JCM 15787 / PB90-1) TaxID=452637 RepID=B1ZZW7_OPITP|nr:protein-tyrosine-phosphatase [Opitutus terrae]ACB77300.1 protein tyrosine phosphatase [Opitutus terrae PB90-1]
MSETVLVVCTANICRSPMAAGLLQHALAAQPEPLKSLNVVSAGVSARNGEPVSENSVVALRKVGIDISQHISRPLTQEMLNQAAAVICMTESHRAMIQLQADPAPKHIYLFREFMPQQGDKEIPDPFGGPLKVYELCRDEMVEAIPSLIEFLKTHLQAKSAPS